MFGAYAPHKALKRNAARRLQSQTAIANQMNRAIAKSQGMLNPLAQQLQAATGMGKAMRAANLHQANAFASLQNSLSTWDTDSWSDFGTNTWTTAPASTTLTVTSTSSTNYITGGGTAVSTGAPALYANVRRAMAGAVRVMEGQALVIDLPDGSKLDVKEDGSYEVIDKDAKLTYRANRLRDFNTYLNASDKLEEFVRFCGGHGISQDEMKNLPVKLFIAWLVQEAAKADQEPEPELQLLPDLRRRANPKCGGCGRFLTRRHVQKRIEFCAPVCFDRHYQRQLEAA